MSAKWTRCGNDKGSGTLEEEIFAHQFARALLMPAKVFKEKWQTYGGSISILAAIFKVEPRRILERAEELKLGESLEEIIIKRMMKKRKKPIISLFRKHS